MSEPLIIVSIETPMATVTLNRPDALNAFTRPMLLELGDALIDLAHRDDVIVVVLTGSGRAFSAGVDLKSLEGRRLQGGRVGAELDDPANRAISEIVSMSKVVIAKVNGYCFTGALELALACDLMITADEAVLGDTHAKFGLRPTWGMSQRLVRAVGIARARALSFTADTFTGRQAATWGLSTVSVPRADLDAEVDAMAQTIAGNSPGSLVAIKDLYRHALDAGLSDGLVRERHSEYQISDTEDRLSEFR